MPGRTNNKPSGAVNQAQWRLERLEPRILLSADPLGAALLLPDEPGAVDRLAVEDLADTLIPVPSREIELPVPVDLDASQAAGVELVFVDQGIENYQQLIDDIKAASADRELRILVLDEQGDGIGQISRALSEYQDISAVHLLSHGNQQGIALGDSWLSSETLDGYREALQGWQQYLSADADLLIYGCNLGADAGGRLLIEQLALVTGADVAASDDLTGAASLGGDWELEIAEGAIESAVILEPGTAGQWNGLLAVETLRDEFNAIYYNNNDGTQNWDSYWLETGDDASASAGKIQVDSYLGEQGLLIKDGNVVVTRAANLGSAVSATLTFDYARINLIDSTQFVALQVSDNGGGTWTDLTRFTGPADDRSLQSASFDISTYASATTQIRFITAGTLNASNRLFVDNVQIKYDTSSNKPPIANDDAYSVNEDSTLNVPAIGLLNNDSDPEGVTITAQLVNSADYGSVVVNPDGSFSYTPNADFYGTDSFLYKVNDGVNDSLYAAVTLTVNPVNDAPTIANLEPGNIGYTENDPATPISASLTLADVDNTTLTGAVVQISSGYQNGEDLLQFSDTANISGSWDAASGTLTLSGSDSLAAYQSALRSVGYLNSSEDPTGGARTLSISVSDGSDSSLVASRELDVTPVNDAPTTAGLATVSVSEDAADTRVALWPAFSDAEQASTTLSYSLQANDNAALFSSVSISAATGELVLDYAPDAFGSANITLRATDSQGAWVETVQQVQVNPVNDAPVGPALDNTLVDENINSSGGLVIGTLSASDVDPGESFSYSIQGGVDAASFSIQGGDQLVITDGILDFERQSSYQVVVRVTDSGNAYQDQAFVIRINDLPEPVSASPMPPPAPAGPVVADPAADDPADTLVVDDSIDESTAEAAPLDSGDKAPTDGTVSDTGAVPAVPTLGEVADLAVATSDASPVTGPDVAGLLRQFALNPVSHAVLRETLLPAFLPQEGGSQLDPLQLSANRNFLSGLDSMRDEVASDIRLDSTLIGSSVAVTTGLSVGYVVWLVRGGVLLSSVLSSLPAWQFVDPLPVLARLKEREESDEGAAPETLESLVSESSEEKRSDADTADADEHEQEVPS